MGPSHFLKYTNSIWFLGPIALSIAALLIYVFFIWYRDWLRQKYIYLSLVNVAYDSNECLFSKSDNDFTICSGSCWPCSYYYFRSKVKCYNGWFQMNFVQICLIYEITKLELLKYLFSTHFYGICHLLWSWNDGCVCCV